MKKKKVNFVIGVIAIITLVAMIYVSGFAIADINNPDTGKFVTYQQNNW